MRAALWLIALFAIAVAAALFAGSNQGTVTLYWPPYRIDLSLNLVALFARVSAPFIPFACETVATAVGEAFPAAWPVGSGAEVLSAVAADGKLTLTYRLGAMTNVRIYDGKSGELIREVPVISE